MSLLCRPHFRRIFSRSGTVFAEQWQLLDHPETKSDHSVQNFDLFSHGNVIEANSRLNQVVKTGHVDDARKMFDKMPNRDEISWTHMISGYIKASDYSEAFLLFSVSWALPGFRMDPFLLSLGFKACGLDMNMIYGEILHGFSVKTGLVNSVFVGSTLVDMYMKFGEIEKSCRVFGEMPLKNVVTWTAVITGLVRAGNNEEGLARFSEMWRSNVRYDSYAFAIALKACADLGDFNGGREIHAQTMKKGFDENSFVSNSLSTMYNKCGKLKYGLYLFEKMRSPDVVSWTTIITTYLQSGMDETAVEAFVKMRENNVPPNEYTYAAVISATANIARVKWGEQLHARVFRVNLIYHLSVANSIVTMYAKCGKLDSASVLFDGMVHRDVISWSTIIAAYSQAGYGNEAFNYLSWMRREGQKPTEFALSSVLSVCGSMAILEQGKQIHAHIQFIGLEKISMIESALINMYSKCGSINEALKIFESKENNDIISWTAMINGYAEHGFSQEAIDLFEKIPEVGIRPDSVTFIGVLAACSHAGLVDLGLNYFNLMNEKYFIDPSKEHYGCMIDLLCRAGRLTEAEGMIKTMPFQRDDVVWSTLLRACRVHGDVECGRRAAEEIIELNPNCAGTHITLANIYAAKGKWREAASIRKAMKSKGVIKEPGWSWVKVRETVSAFVAGDRSHPRGEEIYWMLDLLAFKVEASILDMESFPTDVEEFQKLDII